MDMEVYKQTGDPDEPQQVGSSGKPPGQAEHVELTAPGTGDYFVRVVNYAAAPGTPYTLTIKRQTAGPDAITISGKTEAWHMTCETPDGKVQESRDVTVWRGDVSTQDFGCGQAAVLAAKTAKKAKATKRQACLQRAKRVRAKAKRRTAVRRCMKRYPAAKKKAVAKKKASPKRR
jgi:hypothetical protein